MTKFITYFVDYNFNFITHYCDSSLPWQLGFQDPASPLALSIIKFHNDLMFILIVIVFFITWIIIKIVILFNKKSHAKPEVSITHNSLLETIWTITPAVLLGIIAVPSIAILVSVDSIYEPQTTIKAIGNQWYWTYEYDNFIIKKNTIPEIENQKINNKIVFESFIYSDEDIKNPENNKLGHFRLLETDKRIVIPVYTHVRLIVTSTDVLHSWTVPSLGVKMDACPGRLNETTLFASRKGTYYGQCSELCGVNHAFIPICVEAVNKQEYIKWLFDNSNTTD